MDIASLKIALLVQTQGTFAKAARALDVDPSSVSRAISALEAEVGIRLFQRTTRRLTITDEGRRYLATVAPLVSELDAARDMARGQRATASGHLRLTTSVAFAHEMILPCLGDFQKAYPGITVELLCNDSNLDLVESGIDLALRLAPNPSGAYISRRVRDTTYVPVASPAFLAGAPPIRAPDDLTAVNCLRYALPDVPDTWRVQPPGCGPTNIAVTGPLMVSNALAMRRAAMDGLGVALLADWLVEDALKTGALCPVLPDCRFALTDFDTGVFAIYPSRDYLPRKVRVALDFFADCLRKA